MYLYIELWKAKQAWLDLTDDQRGQKLTQLLTLAQQHPITGVIPFSFHQNADNGGSWLFDGVVERPVIVDTSVARPTGFHYAAAWMVPTRELITAFEDRVEGLGWWWNYFEQENAWGKMDREVTVGDMVSPKPAGQSSEDEVNAAVQLYYACLRSANFEGAASLMAPGMTVYSPHGGLQVVPDNAQEVAQHNRQIYQQGFRMNVTPNDVRVSVHGDTAFSTFTLQGTDTHPFGGPTHAVAFRGTMVWGRSKKTWHITHMHISTSDERESWRGQAR